MNTRGKLGCNIPCDLEMEHRNREFKAHLATAGGNITSNTIVRTGKALNTLSSVCHHFDNSTNVAPSAVHHSTKNATKDEEILVHTLHSKCKVFQRKGFHSTPKFQKVSRYNFSRINKPKLKEWFKKHIRKMKVREITIRNCSNHYLPAKCKAPNELTQPLQTGQQNFFHLI